MSLRKYDYRRKLPHLQRDSKPLFVSFRTHRSWILSPQLRDIALECCLFQHGKRIRLHAGVVMPEHVHLLLSALTDANGESYSIPEIMQNIKSVSAHKINRAAERTGKVWQVESFDHLIRSSREFDATIAYIAENPVMRRLVNKPSDYKWLCLEREVFHW
ncbi:MAG: REP-associated tyrosine transposase [Terriglobales bacterium]